MSRDRLLLESIPALTFYAGEETVARRSDPIPQLTCIGNPCKLYQPEVVRCENIGGKGTEVEWKCQADLPEALRFGRVDVSCEGYSRPGDSHVLKGSCGLQYRLVQIPGTLRNEDEGWSNKLNTFSETTDVFTLVFNIVWCGLLVFMLYHLLSSCFRGRQDRAPPADGARPGEGGDGRPGGWLPGFDDRDDRFDSPPPYSKYTSAPNAPAAQQGPGWGQLLTGAAAGGLASHLWNRRQEQQRPRQAWDWETDRTHTAPRTRASPRARTSWFDSDDRGEGSSSGTMRTSTGLGGSSVR
ncbi:hypothetical protein BD626DRAFT_491139 [Schizophyllum amplum]|uniref:Store-operated calcium entry-associated regulatory factor n=1 Tax=Schizophyllum amplum TaxID=97359 RepID=A0A550CHF4_9AGAR|nr:hypothetical protein BD626DRAFT_491139 [Auriculariopsis ampla]